ncbi:MAG: DNA translocase FtsK [Vibrio sp.]
MLGGFPSESDEKEEQEAEFEDEEPLLSDAIRHVRETRRGSVSGLQRKFKIGYNRAARIVEMLEQMNVVSKPSNDGVREVLLPPIDAVSDKANAMMSIIESELESN